MILMCPLYNRFHRGEWITRVSGGEGALDTPGPLNDFGGRREEGGGGGGAQVCCLFFRFFSIKTIITQLKTIYFS